MLFLVESKIETVFSPGDDDMTEPKYEDILRLVEAADAIEAAKKFREFFERDEPGRIRIFCEYIKVHDTIR